MTSTQFLAFYEKLWELPEGTLDLSQAPDVTGDWDSLALLNTIVLIDREFGRTVTGHAIKQCRTFGEILELGRAGSSE